MNAREIIRAEYGTSKNFFTPHVVEIRSIVRGKVAAEISYGNGIFAKYMVGVSVASVNDDGTTERNTNELSASQAGNDLSKLLQWARDYVEELKEDLD